MAKDQEFTEWLKAARVRHGLNQREMAEMTGIPVRTYQEYEQGRCLPGSNRMFTLVAMFGTWFDVEQNLTEHWTRELANDHA